MLSIEYMSVMVICPTGRANDGSILADKKQLLQLTIFTLQRMKPFRQVSADHAYKEGEGDKSLAYWRQVHEDCFVEWLREAGMTFTPNSKVVLEEFRKVYPLQNMRVGQLSRAVKADAISVVEPTQPLRLARQSKDN